MNKIASVLLLLVVFGLSSPSLAAAMSDSEIEEAIQTTLDMRHPKDTGEWWKSLGPSAPKVIIAIYGKTSSTYRRLRLVGALAWFKDDPMAAEFLKTQARETSDDVIRNGAIQSLAIADGTKELDFIAGYLTHSDPQTRLAAAQALRDMNDPRASERVEKFLREEKLPWVVSRLKNEPLPSPSGVLAPVSSNEERLNPDFAGKWKGVWVAPKGQGIHVEAVTAQLKTQGVRELKGELVRKGGQTVPLSSGEGKGPHASGQLSGARFEAEFSREAGATWLRIRIPSRGETLVLRRNAE